MLLRANSDIPLGNMKKILTKAAYGGLQPAPVKGSQLRLAAYLYGEPQDAWYHGMGEVKREIKHPSILIL